MKVLGVGNLGANEMAVRLVLQVNPRVSISMTVPNGDENIINAVAIIVSDLHIFGIQLFFEHSHIQSDEIGAVSLFGNTSVEIVMILLRAIIDEIVAGSQWPHIHGDKDTVFPIENLDTSQHFYRLKGASHAMILTHYKWFNKELPELLISHTI